MTTKPPKEKEFGPRTGFLWKWALGVVVIGGVVVTMLWRELPDPSAIAKIRITILLCALVVGILIISATANFWTRR